jgi:hypothetical protein
VGGGERPFFSPDTTAGVRDDYELFLRTGGKLGAKTNPWYEEFIDLGILFHERPEDIHRDWDKVWLDRTRVILQGRRAAGIDTSQTTGGDE